MRRYKRLKLYITLFIVIIMFCFAQNAYAANYSYDLGRYYSNYGFYSYAVSDIDLIGINKTHGFTQKILGTAGLDRSGNYWYGTLTYSVPDDGSTWQIIGSVQIYVFVSNPEGISREGFAQLVNIDQTRITSGTFTGVSIGQAVNAANTANTAAGQARTAANNANTAATNAATAANNAVTVSTQARDAANSAKTSADNATTAAGTASTNAQNAYNEAVVINNKLDALSGDVSSLDTSEIVAAVKDPSGTVIDVSRASHGAVEDANGNTINAVRDADGTVLDASRTARDASQEAVSKIDALQTTVNNYMSSDTTPPVVSLSTVSGARATSGSSILAIVDVSDNLSSTFTYSLNGTDYQPLPEDRKITLPVSTSGMNIITVWVKDEAGNTSQKSINIRKL